ncbi:MAG TPA: hypothetical protein VFD70_18160, partial [Anaerolineae bacterium]|nr:hypothetical protein [Anaerolineae bacterium]
PFAWNNYTAPIEIPCKNPLKVITFASTKQCLSIRPFLYPFAVFAAPSFGAAFVFQALRVPHPLIRFNPLTATR